jgi:hypothetical protein
MQIYGPSQNKIQAIKETNPTYWQLLLTRSEYSENEINQELANIDEANTQLHSFLTSAYDLLVWEDGKEMNYIPNGFASDAHQALSAMLSEISYINPSFSQNSHSNCFPVNKWQKEVKSLISQIAKIEKFIKGSIK